MMKKVLSIVLVGLLLSSQAALAEETGVELQAEAGVEVHGHMQGIIYASIDAEVWISANSYLYADTEYVYDLKEYLEEDVVTYPEEKLVPYIYDELLPWAHEVLIPWVKEQKANTEDQISEEAAQTQDYVFDQAIPELFRLVDQVKADAEEAERQAKDYVNQQQDWVEEELIPWVDEVLIPWTNAYIEYLNGEAEKTVDQAEQEVIRITELSRQIQQFASERGEREIHDIGQVIAYLMALVEQEIGQTQGDVEALQELISD